MDRQRRGTQKRKDPTDRYIYQISHGAGLRYVASDELPPTEDTVPTDTKKV